jgi:hypothetical protein
MGVNPQMACANLTHRTTVLAPYYRGRVFFRSQLLTICFDLCSGGPELSIYESGWHKLSDVSKHLHTMGWDVVEDCAELAPGAKLIGRSVAVSGLAALAPEFQRLPESV